MLHKCGVTQITKRVNAILQFYGHPHQFERPVLKDPGVNAIFQHLLSLWPSPTGAARFGMAILISLALLVWRAWSAGLRLDDCTLLSPYMTRTNGHKLHAIISGSSSNKNISVNVLLKLILCHFGYFSFILRQWKIHEDCGRQVTGYSSVFNNFIYSNCASEKVNSLRTSY
jgi:hypothetical protein